MEITALTSPEIANQPNWASIDRNADALVIASLSSDRSTVAVSSSAANNTFQEILKKLNDILAKQLPDGIESLKPEDVTPEATANRIVSGIEGLFASFAKANPTLSSEELVSGFMERARAGVERGYDDAVSTLTEVGALEIDGVSSGIKKTKELLSGELDALEERLRKSLGIDVESQTAQLTESAFLQQAASQGLSIVV